MNKKTGCAAIAGAILLLINLEVTATDSYENSNVSNAVNASSNEQDSISQGSNEATNNNGIENLDSNLSDKVPSSCRRSPSPSRTGVTVDKNLMKRNKRKKEEFLKQIRDGEKNFKKVDVRRKNKIRKRRTSGEKRNPAPSNVHKYTLLPESPENE